MSISRRIRDQVEKLDVNRNMKDLMLDILAAESRGTGRYKGLYDKKIQQYLEKKSNKGGND